MEENIINNNKLIAEFMGGIYANHMPYLTYPSEYWINTPANDSGITPKHYDLKYHSSWDWLMPVVEKIESITRLTVLLNGTAVSVAGLGYNKITEGKNRMGATYEAVIQFVEWYNKKQPH